MCQAAKTQAQLIREGVIDPESLVHASEIFEEKVLDGQYALIAPAYMGLSDINERLKKNNAPFRYRPFFTQVPAAEGFEKGKVESDPIWGEALCILNTLSEEELHQGHPCILIHDMFRLVYQLIDVHSCHYPKAYHHTKVQSLLP